MSLSRIVEYGDKQLPYIPHFGRKVYDEYSEIESGSLRHGSEGMMMERNQRIKSNISVLGRILRWFAHGFIVGGAVLITFFGYQLGSYYMLRPLGGLFMTAIAIIGFSIPFLGLINHALAEYLWGIGTDKSFVNVYRDGFILLLTCVLIFSPFSSYMAFINEVYRWSIPPDWFTYAILVGPIFFVFMYGVIGNSLAGFLYSLSSEQDLPRPVGEYQKCPHCGAKYHYAEDVISPNGVVICQNCQREFKIALPSEK